jgi:hypothetical protein
MKCSAYHEKKDIPYLLCLGIYPMLMMVSLFIFEIPQLIIRVLGAGYFLGAGYILARRIAGVAPFSAFLLAPLTSVAPLTIIGSAFYLFASLSTPVIATLLWVPFITAVISVFRVPSHQPPLPEKVQSASRTARIGMALYAFLMGSFLLSIIAQRTSESLLGPWDHIAPISFVLYFLSTVVLIATLYRGITRSVALAGIAVHLGASISVALLRFPLGFGFDPLLHHAAERIVLEQGVVLPKTLYYVGQYVLVPFLARIFSLPVEWVHQPLLPILVALSIPVLAYEALTKFFHAKKRIALLGILAMLMIPYEYSIMTTPWGLAYNTTILALMSSMIACEYRQKYAAWLAGVLGLFALTLHPLAGIPLTLFLFMCAAHTIRRTLTRSILLVGGTLLAAVSIPLAFYLNSLVSPQFRLTLAVSNVLGGGGSWFGALFQSRFSPLLDAIYVIPFDGWLFFVLFALYGAFLLLGNNDIIQKQSARQHVLIVCLLMAAALRVEAYITAEFIHFESLASFEQQDYAERLVRIADLFLLPFVASALLELLNRILLHKNTLLRITLMLIMAGSITAALYLSYPHNDAYTPFHGYTLSNTDIAVARFIDRDGADERSIVIANQVVASAAIREFGFKTYYEPIINGTKQSVFYYPVPGGSPLAPFYYSMLLSPTRETMREAMNIVGATRSYFVVHKREPRFPVIVRDAKQSADEWNEIDQGKAYVFTYRNTPDSAARP